MRNLLLSAAVIFSFGAAIIAAHAEEPQFPERTPDNFREVPPYGPRDGGFNGTGNQGMGDLSVGNRGGFAGGNGAAVNDGFGGGAGNSASGVGGVSPNQFPNSDSVQSGGAATHQGNGQLGPGPVDTPRPSPVPSSTTTTTPSTL